MFDAVVLSAIVRELESGIRYGRVQEIVQLDALAFAFEVYAGHARQNLYVGVHPDDARVHLVGGKLRGGGQEPAGLLTLLRKYVQGAFVDRIEQLPHERVVRFQFDHATEGVSTLVVETIGKYSNLILLDAEGIVIDAAKRVSASVNRVRVILPHHPYAPPPPQPKRDPAGLAPAELAAVLAEDRGRLLWQALVGSLAGVSPLFAREIAFRVAGRTDAPVGKVQAEQVLEVWDRLAHAPWQPTLALEAGEPAEFAPYALEQYQETRRYATMSAALDAFFGAPDTYAAAKAPWLATLAEVRDRLARKREALAGSLPDAASIERLKTNGELVLGYAFQVMPGQTVLRAETEMGWVDIPLDPHLSAVENAQKYFGEYRRAQDAAARVPALLAAAQTEVEYVEQLLNDLELAENRPEIDAVLEAARQAGWLTSARRRGQVPVSEPRTFHSKDGMTILVGKNARQNEEITFRRARPDDVWLHTRAVAGAHVVILRAGRTVTEETVAEAARLAAHYSRARGETQVDVMIAERKNVHRQRGAARRPGLVTVRASRVLRVTL